MSVALEVDSEIVSTAVILNCHEAVVNVGLNPALSKDAFSKGISWPYILWGQLAPSSHQDWARLSVPIV